MATYTKYKSLEKPLSTERYNVAVANKNNDVIDSELHKLELKNQSQDSLLATKDALNSEISRATARENDIIQDLTAEISRAKSSENELSDHIQNEIDRAIQAETDIKEELDNYLPITGGTLKSTTDFFPLRLERTTGATGCGLEFKGTAGAVGNIQMTYDTSSNNENELRCFVKDEDKKDHGVLYVSRDRKKVYSKEAGGLKNIMTDYEVPFRFGIDSSGDYGYYRNDTGEFVKIDVPEANNENASNSFFASVNQSGSYEMKFYFSNLLKDYKEETPSKNNSVLSAIMKIEVFSNGTLELYSDSGLWGTTGKKQYIDSYLYLCNSESEIYKNPSGYDRIRQRIILKEIGESLKTQYGTITSFSNSKNNGINGYTYEDFGLICSPASGYWFNVNIIPLSN